MRVWVEIAKESDQSCYVFQCKPVTRGYDFGYTHGPTDGVTTFDSDTDLNYYLRECTLRLQWIEISESSFLYEVDLDD